MSSTVGVRAAVDLQLAISSTANVGRMTAHGASPGETERSPQATGPTIALGVIVVVWALGPIFTKLISMPPVLGVLLRFSLTIPLLVGLMYVRGNRFSRDLIKRTALPGIAFGLNQLFVFQAIQEVTVAVLAVTIALQPALVLIVAGPIFGEWPTRTHVAWTIVGVGGAAGVILGAGGDLKASPIGVFYACLVVTAFTVFFIFTRLVRSQTFVDPIGWMAAINVWALVIILPAAALLIDRSDFSTVGGKDWLWLGLIAIGPGTMGHVLMSWVHAYVDASRSSLTLLSMNVIAVLLAWPIFDEPMTLVQALAGAVVLGAVAAVLRIPPRAAADAGSSVGGAVDREAAAGA